MAQSLSILDRRGAAIELPAHEIDDLKSRLSGELLTGYDQGYEQAREVWNGAVTHEPSLIVSCRDEADVVAAISFAHRHQIALSVRGGGHNISGRGLIPGGMTINLGAMNQVVVETQQKTASVQGGALLRDVDTGTSRHNLAVPLGVAPTTGAVGLALGGGMGRLSRKFGLTCDNLKSARIVTARGEVLDVSDHEHPDLFWAIRGGGGNFGIATEMRFNLHPIPEKLLSGKLIYGEDKLRESLQLYRQLLLEGPDELGLDATLFVDSEGVKTLEFTICYNGSVERGWQVMELFSPLGEPLLQVIEPKPYVSIQHSDHTPPGRKYHYRGGFIETMSDELIEALIAALEEPPLPSSGSEIFIALQQSGGAVSRVPSSATAFYHRRALCNIICYCIADDQQEYSRLKQRVETMAESMEGYYSGHYANDASDQLAGRVRETFGDNLSRLKAVKRKYDPDNIFCRNANIPVDD